MKIHHLALLLMFLLLTACQPAEELPNIPTEFEVEQAIKATDFALKIFGNQDSPSMGLAPVTRDQAVSVPAGDAYFIVYQDGTDLIMDVHINGTVSTQVNLPKGELYAINIQHHSVKDSGEALTLIDQIIGDIDDQIRLNKLDLNNIKVQLYFDGRQPDVQYNVPMNVDGA